MTGVASRNEKLADSSWSRPPRRPATIVDAAARDAGEEREDLRRADGDRARDGDIESSSRCATWRPRRASQALAAEQDDSVDREEDGRGQGLGEEDAQLVLEQRRPTMPDRDRGDRQDEEQSIVGVHLGVRQPPQRRDALVGARLQLAARGRERGSRHVRAVVDDEPERGAHVQTDDEGEEERLGLRTGCSTRLCQPSRAGNSTQWPRLEIGKSSVTPCSEAHDDGLEVGQGEACTPQR